MHFPQWSSGIGKYILRLNDGDSVVGVFRGDVTKHYQHWNNGRGTICPGKANCPLCNSEKESDRKATGRFRVNFIVFEKDGTLTPRIFEAGKRVYDQLKSINADCPLEKTKVRISRSGKGQATQTMVSVVPGENGILNAKAEKAVLAIPLFDLGPEAEVEDDEAAEVAGVSDGDVPF